MLREVMVGFVDDASKPQWVARARGGVIDAWLRIGWTVGGDREHCVDDEVGGDDVEQRVGQTREVLQHAAAEREDERLGHPKTFEPSGGRLIERALDD